MPNAVALGNGRVTRLDTAATVALSNGFKPLHNIPPRDQTIGAAISGARDLAQLGLRELSRRSGVAAPQISRLENGEVKKPTVETLVALARGLDWNPVPLLIIAGYVETDEARRRLRDYHAPGSEYLEEASPDPESDPQVAALRSEIEDPKTSLERLQQIAFDVWFGGESGETLWDDVYQALPALGERQSELRELVTMWPGISFDRRARIVEYARDQYHLSLAEIRAETDAYRHRPTAVDSDTKPHVHDAVSIHDQAEESAS